MDLLASLRSLRSTKNWRLTDETLALIVLLVSFVIQNEFFYGLRGLAIAYLFMCLGFRKYEAIKRKYDK